MGTIELLKNMQEKCLNGGKYDDPLRMEKYQALEKAIKAIENLCADNMQTCYVNPKFPPTGTKYYYVIASDDICDSTFNKGYTTDILNFKIGNFFLTFEEAKRNKEKILKIFNSPEKFKGMADK